MGASLSDRYRPGTLDEIAGQDRVKAILRAFLANPGPSAFLLSGASGLGKTTAALCLAGAISDDMDTVHAVGQDVSADWLRETWRTLGLCPWVAGKWRVLIVDEADSMSNAARTLLLRYLEEIPPRAIVILTSNDRVKEDWEPRLWSRFKVLPFTNQGVAAPAAKRLVDIAAKEGYKLPETHALRYVREAGNNIRAALNALETDMLAGFASGEAA